MLSPGLTGRMAMPDALIESACAGPADPPCGVIAAVAVGTGLEQPVMIRVSIVPVVFGLKAIWYPAGIPEGRASAVNVASGMVAFTEVSSGAPFGNVP